MSGVIIDSLEPLQMDELLGRHMITARASLAKKYLDYMFYVGNDVFTIERKSVFDLAARVNDLERQLKTAMLQAKYVALVVEGVMKPIDNGRDTLLYAEKKDGSIFYSTRTAGRPYSYYMGFLYELFEHGIPVFWTANIEGTAETVVEIVKLASLQAPSGIFNRIIRTKHSLVSVDAQVQSLVNIGVGEQAATLLIGKYKSVWKAIHAPDQELLTIPKIGAKTIERLNTLFGKHIL